MMAFTVLDNIIEQLPFGNNVHSVFMVQRRIHCAYVGQHHGTFPSGSTNVFNFHGAISHEAFSSAFVG